MAEASPQLADHRPRTTAHAIESARPLLGKTALALTLRLMGAAVLFGTQLWLARTLGVAAFGQVALVLAWHQMATIVARFGFDQSTLRWATQYQQQSDFESLRRFRTVRRRIRLTVSAVLQIGGGTAFVIYSGGFESPLLVPTCILLLLIPVSAAIEHFAADLRATQDILAAESVLWVARPSLWLVLCGLAVTLLPRGLNQTTAIGAYAIASLITWLIANLSQRPAASLSLPGDTIAEAESAWTQGAMSMLASTVAAQALAQTDVLLLGLLADAEQVGIYALATRMAGLVSFGLAALNAVTAVQLAQYAAARDFRGLQIILRRVVALSTVLAIPAVLVCGIAAKFVLPWLGMEYAQADWPLALLLMGQLMNTFCGPVGQLAIATGHELRLARVIVACAAANAILQVFAIKVGGIYGAAATSALSMMAWNVILARQMSQELGVDPTLLSFLSASRSDTQRSGAVL